MRKTNLQPLESLDYLDHEAELLQNLLESNQQTNAEIRQLQKISRHLQEQLASFEKAVLKKTFDERLKRYIKGLFDPRIGKLHQHNPILFAINPKKYRKMPVLKNPPVISIVTPSYNQGDFLETTIASLLMQEYPALEYIIQDGGSTDSTPALLEKYRYALTHCESKKDNGQSHALNLGFKQTSGDIMAYLNSDDLLMMGALHYVADYFARHPEVDVVYGHRVIINELNQEIGRWVLPPHDNEVLKWADYIPQETLFWRRRIWEKTGGFIDENFHFAMDWDLLLRFKEAGAKFARLPRFLGAFRVHSQQKTSSNMDNTGEKEMMQLRIRSHGRPIIFSEVKARVKRYETLHLLCHYLYKWGVFNY